MDGWSLPKTAEFGGKKYSLNTDFRDVLEIISYLTDKKRTEYIRWRIAVGLFYEPEVPEEYLQDAMQYLANFISYGSVDGKPSPKLIDWQQDVHMIVGDINKVAGQEVRALQYLHWWTFLSYFYGIGEGQLSTVVSIRRKKAKGKKLEKWEQEYYRENKDVVDFKANESEEVKKEKENIMRWL